MLIGCVNRVLRCIVRCVDLKCVMIGCVEGAWIVYVKVHERY